MSTKKFLDLDGLSRVWNKISGKFAVADEVINATDLAISNRAVNLVTYVNSPGIYKVPSACWIYTDSASSTANRIYALAGDIVKIDPQIDAGDGEEIVEFDSFFTIFSSTVFAGVMVTTDNIAWTSSVMQYERQGNKVTTISSSSRDAQYPSAKAVYDYVNSLVVDGAKKTILYNGKANSTAILSGIEQELDCDDIHSFDMMIIGCNADIGNNKRTMEITQTIYPSMDIMEYCDKTGAGATGAFHIPNTNINFNGGNGYRVMWGFTDKNHIRNIVSNPLGSWTNPGICYVIGYKFSALPDGYATEQYVDNAIASAITSAIGGSY